MECLHHLNFYSDIFIHLEHESLPPSSKMQSPHSPTENGTKNKSKPKELSKALKPLGRSFEIANKLRVSLKNDGKTKF